MGNTHTNKTKQLKSMNTCLLALTSESISTGSADMLPVGVIAGFQPTEGVTLTFIIQNMAN